MNLTHTRRLLGRRNSPERTIPNQPEFIYPTTKSKSYTSKFKLFRATTSNPGFQAIGSWAKVPRLRYLGWS